MSEQPSVIHVDDGREWRGGQHQVFLLATGLAKRGITQNVVTPPGSPLAERLVSAGIQVSPMEFRGELDFRSSRALADLAQSAEATILHAHTAHAHTHALGAVKRLRKLMGADAPKLVITRRVDFPVARGFFSRRKYLFPHQHYIAISEGVSRVLQEGGIPGGRIDLVPSGVPPIPPDKAVSRSEVRRELGIAENEIAIVNVGALTDHKGHRWLVEAASLVMKRHRNARFHVFGEGELRQELEAQIRGLKLDGIVKLGGYISNARLKLAGFDIYVSSSHLEGMGTAILDAMLAGLPVVAAGAGGVTDIVIHNQTGLLVPPRDSYNLAQSLIHAIEMPETQRAFLIKAARENVEVNFSSERMIEGNLEVYRRLMASSG